MRVCPIAYTPAVVVGPYRTHLIEVRMPHKGRWLFQAFFPDQLLVIDKQNQSPLLTHPSMI